MHHVLVISAFYVMFGERTQLCEIFAIVAKTKYVSGHFRWSFDSLLVPREREREREDRDLMSPLNKLTYSSVFFFIVYNLLMITF